MHTITFKTDKNKGLLKIAEGTIANPLGINYNRKEYEKECINESFALQQRLAQDCRSAVLQINK